MGKDQWKHRVYADVMRSAGLLANARQIGRMVRHVWPFEIAIRVLKHELTANEADIATAVELQSAQDAMTCKGGPARRGHPGHHLGMIDAEMRNFEFERTIVDGPMEADPEYAPDYDKNA